MIPKHLKDICGERDKKLLSGENEMSFADFQRLSYITDFLGFNDDFVFLLERICG